MDAVEILYFLRNKYKSSSFKTALVGTYKEGRYVDPPLLRTDAYLLFVPLALSIFPIFLTKEIISQWIAGITIIILTYLALYIYLRRGCFVPDEVRVLKTNHGDVEYLRRNKLEILENPSLLSDDYEIYYVRPNVCVTRDKKANAFTLDGPGGPIMYFTTGLFARLEPEELQAVLEHEMGHIKYKHTYKLLAFLAAEYTLRLPLVHLVYAKYSILLLAVHMIGATFLFTALLQAFEFEADRHAAMKDRNRLIAALVKLDWNGIVESVINPLAARLTLLARTHPLTIDRIRKLNALPN
ncbi:peptidase M48, Ste24p [Pyrobaculum islandicum DSM 4184]|uniref:Peptidase M48, Ste24p n=1 Tax=Pyrobaculum islandicum (strain DSM 4184 / JCM 9189 / GEO3) TaxID=384616 RepID=A1RT26_PYRIL|nr:M48 family metallopeptidase [Pyrobaculum islandicum]ABL88108.1 peptidase M48, Ste24p [Pyrobaculum islandicum DSM 4184]